MEAEWAVTLALNFVDGLRLSGAAASHAEASALIEHLAGNGFVVRPREGAEWRRAGRSTWDASNVTPSDIRNMRERQGLTRAALAAMSGVSASSIERLEKARGIPHAQTLAAVLDALGRSGAGIGVDADRGTT